MENFVVSALKYRPQTFDTVVGQAHITTTLKNAIKNNQLAHAFLFCGPRGVGKTTCARILAKTINCENRTPEGEACNQCDSCKSFNNGQSFNIHELDAASNNSVDDIRALTDQVRYAPQAGRYKVYIIDEVHMLSQQAFNAFLKTLEEPPPYAVFILATTEKHKILPTILSRCQIFDFKRITIHDTVDHLKDICKKEKISADPDSLHLIAQKTEGCMRDALSTLDKIVSFTNGQLTYENTLEHLNILDYDYYFRLMEYIRRQDTGAALLLFDEILQKGFEGDHFLEGLSAFIRDLLVCKDKQSIKLLEVTGNLKNRYEKASAEADAAYLISALNILNEASIQVRLARNKRLLVEMCLIRLSYLQQAVELIADERSGAVSKKKVTEPATKPQMLRPPLPRAILMVEGELKSKHFSDMELKQEDKKAVEYPKATVKTTFQEPSVAFKKTEIRKDEISGKKSSKNSTILSSSGKLDLATIRKSVEKKENESAENADAIPELPLELNQVKDLWEKEVVRLKGENRLQAAMHVEAAVIFVISENELVIGCSNELQKSFVDEERVPFAEMLKSHFNNMAIIVTVRVDDSLREVQKGPEILSQRQQWERMAKKYPLVKELKDNLNLDLG
ncbi:MAG: DNA polymerase III subunit gamma/tau [Chitinophagaceae bacterium]|nr:MAG: DNA polymerase III subunit gamma/tau [Chitinophagaceae bacterium]